MTRRTFLAATAAAPLLPAAETSQQKGKRIVDRMLAALGGPAFLAMRDRTEIGRAYSFYREELSGLSVARIYTKYGQPPLGVSERQTFGKKQDSAIIFTKGEGFEITFRGARPLADTLVERYRESTLHNVFFILHRRLQEPGIGFDSRGLDVIENQPVEIVDIYDSENRTVTVYCGSSTFLPLRQRFYRRDPITKDRREELSHFTKYKDAGGGVMWPLDLQRERDGEKIFQMYSDSVTINNNLPDAMFNLPGGLKILKKEAGQ